MRSYYRIMLGKACVHANECIAGGFIGTGFGINEDLTSKLSPEWRTFNAAYIPVYLSLHPDKTKIGAGLACGALWTVSKEILKGDVVLSPDGTGSYRVGDVTSDYYYAPGSVLPHRRRVSWREQTIAKSEMTTALQNSAGSIGTVCNITVYHEEIERLLAALGAPPANPIVSIDPEVEDPLAFAMEKHLEDFLVKNWQQMSLSQDFDIYQEDGELVGQQYRTDAGPIDVLAISKDKKRLLVVELKRGRARDSVVGQILRYMGFVKEQIALPDQLVEGVIIALEDDQMLRWALLAVPSISFYRYQISFKLVKG